ncbi:MAG: LysM peptidoglycan-binding domain-containing protein [Candidatus Omnitrophica bacterium]|nr:LysM peptidoglycan-binding domain-containing protein [Candidatus Omnitrophota bacterium]
MERRFTGLLALLSVFVLSGCIVRTYPLTRDRVDQDMTGNRGYLQGQAPAGEEKPKATTRRTQIVEIELGSPIKFEKMKHSKKENAPAPATDGLSSSEGNRGYISQSVSPEIATPEYQKYTVQKGDTLQKISKKYFGTTKKWTNIYEANKDTMSGPDKIYPGKVINIPALPETKTGSAPVQENLK